MSRNQVLAAAALALVVGAAAVFVLMPSGHQADAQGSSSAAPGSSSGATAVTSTTWLHAASFTAPVPAGWTVREQSNAKGTHQFQLGSTKASINGVGIGPAGTVAVTITAYSPQALTHGHIAGKPASTYSPAALLAYVVGQPAQAEGVQVGQHPTATTLAGAPAAEEAFFYGYRSRENLQVDVIAKHAGRLYMVELDAEPRLRTASESALSQILGGWRFS
jgi:hypothetical protein